jgi:hypothetical protein
MRSGMFSGASGPQAVKRANDNIKSDILIWLEVLLIIVIIVRLLKD